MYETRIIRVQRTYLRVGGVVIAFGGLRRTRVRARDSRKGPNYGYHGIPVCIIECAHLNIDQVPGKYARSP